MLKKLTICVNTPKNENEAETEVDCYFLTIIKESEEDFIKCDEIKKYEDEIEKRIDAL